MRIRWLLVLVLILILIAPTLTLFQSPPPYSYQTSASGSSVVVIAKEDYVYARVLITIQPDGINQMATVTFPNGTSTTITGSHTESIVLPNTIYYTFSDVATSGEGYFVSGGHPLDVTVLTGENATNFLLFDAPVPISGIHVFHLVVDGAVMVQTQVLGVSL
jgi:hypothetical protein